MENRTHVEKINGTIVGYDPGGNEAHGFALLTIKDGEPEGISVTTLSNAEAVIKEIRSKAILGLGVDTLSCWCTGNSGWRPADIWLRTRYPEVINSIMSPNALSGSMGINGMSVLIETAKMSNDITLSETHPKVLYYALIRKRYDYDKNHVEMDDFLSKRILGLNVKTSNSHEWDAAISAYALMMGITGMWTCDLHKLKLENNYRLVQPCGKTFYYWPED